jgi:Uma2 family endonuclease
VNKPAPHSSVDQDFKARFTTAEFLRMGAAGAFEDMKIELVNGELERMSPAMSAHGGSHAKLIYRLVPLVPEALMQIDVSIDLSGDTVRAPDAVVLRSAVEGDRLLQPGDVLLAVEISETTLARDMGAKRIDYARAGIPHYWVVDIERRVVHIFAEPVAADYADVKSVRFGEPLAVPGTDRTIILD